MHGGSGGVASTRASWVLAPGAFRLLLAAVVVLSHVSRFDVGRLAVLAFFLLSGYWTARIWAEKFAGQDLGRFYAARWLRIAPLYLLVMLLTAWLLRAPVGPTDLALLGVASTGASPLPVAWSLDVELQFYLVAPLVFAWLSRVPARWAVAASLACGLVGVWLKLRFGLVSAAMYAPAFVLGVLTYAHRWRPSERAAGVSLGLFAAASALTLLTPFMDKTVADPFDRDVYGLLWLLPLTPWIARSLNAPSSRADRHLGNLSYPLYLVHLPVIILVQQQAGAGPAAGALAVAAACAAATALYALVDRPLDRWRLWLTEDGPRPGRPRAPRPSAPAAAPAAPAAFARADGGAAARIGEARRTFAADNDGETAPLAAAPSRPEPAQDPDARL